MIRLTKNKSRVLVYLSNCPNMNKYKQTICRKLDINYGYLHNILGQMEERKWIRKIRSNMRVYYVLLADAPLTEAKEFLSKQEDKENEITRNRAKEN